jgi:hypothetical protein
MLVCVKGSSPDPTHTCMQKASRTNSCLLKQLPGQQAGRMANTAGCHLVHNSTAKCGALPPHRKDDISCCVLETCGVIQVGGDACRAATKQTYAIRLTAMQGG